MNQRIIQWPAEALWQAIAPTLPGFTVEIVPHIDSTNSELMRRARAGQFDPVLLVAEQQSAGRGRLGRDWRSEGTTDNGGTLTFSLGLPLAPRDWSGLSLAVGLSVAQSLHPDLRLKWPNDVWLEQRKLAGILIETANAANAAPGTRYTVIGVGINISACDATGLSTPPASLRERLPGVDAPQALLRIVGALVQTVQAFEASGFAPFQTRFNARDALHELPVTLSNGHSGLALGVDGVGALRVQTAQGLQHITSAEVSVRPQAPTSESD